MPRQRGETWASQETMLFLNLFSKSEVQEKLNSYHRNQEVYEDLAERMNAHGYIRTAHQLRIKAKDLKRKYRHHKNNSSEPDKEDSFWRYYSLLDNILDSSSSNDHDMRPEAAASPSPAVKKNKEHAKELGSTSSQPADEVTSDKSQGLELPTCRSRRPSGASICASTTSSTPTKRLSRRILKRPLARPAVHLSQRRARKNDSMKEFTEAFLQYNRSMETFQQIFQDQTDMQRQERQKMQRVASKTTKETKVVASQVQEAILVQATAINRVADAINRHNELLERFISESGPQKGQKECLQDDGSTAEGAPARERSSLPHSSFGEGMYLGSTHSTPYENLFQGLMGF